MEKVYDIMLGDKPIGNAIVKKEGLYYHFCCSCRLSGEILYRLVVTCGERTENLGICIPKGNGFGLDRKVPVKRLGEGNLLLYVVPKHGELNGKFIPIRDDEPFAYIGSLQKAYLEIRSAQLGVVVPDDPNNC